MKSTILELLGAALIVCGIAILSPALAIILAGIGFAVSGYAMGDRK